MTKNKNATRSDLGKVDAHIVQPHEYDEAPELTDAQLAAATVSPAGLRPRGRPKADVTKEAISLRVDADVIAAFKASGPGWQSRMNIVLRDAVLPDPESPSGFRSLRGVTLVGRPGGPAKPPYINIKKQRGASVTTLGKKRASRRSVLAKKGTASSRHKDT
jgi:uncharacterized protein (DUF4415 family)